MSDRKTLLPLYNTILPAIRAADPNGIVFFEPVVMNEYKEDGTGQLSDFPAGGIGSPQEAPTKQSFAYHLYCAPSNDTNRVGWKVLCDFVVGAGWRAVRGNLKRLGLAGFMTEFGAVGQDTPSLAAVTKVLDSADAALQSWAYWTYKSYDDITTQNRFTETFFTESGDLQMDKLRALSRPYAQMVAGIPRTMVWDRKAGTFVLTYTTETPRSNVTESVVYVPTLSYPEPPTWRCCRECKVCAHVCGGGTQWPSICVRAFSGTPCLLLIHRRLGADCPRSLTTFVAVPTPLELQVSSQGALGSMGQTTTLQHSALLDPGQTITNIFCAQVNSTACVKLIRKYDLVECGFAER